MLQIWLKLQCIFDKNCLLTIYVVVFVSTNDDNRTHMCPRILSIFYFYLFLDFVSIFVFFSWCSFVSLPFVFFFFCGNFYFLALCFSFDILTSCWLSLFLILSTLPKCERLLCVLGKLVEKIVWNQFKEGQNHHVCVCFCLFVLDFVFFFFCYWLCVK